MKGIDVMLDKQKEFKRLMEILVGEDLGDKLWDKHDLMKKDCQKWQRQTKDSMDRSLKVGPEKGFEPAPFYFSGGKDLAQLAVIGINPGDPLKKWKNMDANMTWQNLAEFCIPTEGIKTDEKKSDEEMDNAYLRLAKNAVESKFYRDVFMIHHALLGGNKKTYDKFSEMVNAYGGRDNIEKEFIKRLGEYPIFNGELIPYKSQKASIDWKKMMTDKNYHNYLNRLLDLVIDSTEKNAYIIFYGGRDNVRKLLSVAASDKFPSNIWRWYMLDNPADKDSKTDVYFAHWYDERVVILLPSRAHRVCYSIKKLKDKIDKYRLGEI